MNSITRLILHRLASGNVRLTTQVIEILKEVRSDCPADNKPEKAGSEPAAAAEPSDRDSPAEEKHLTFVNPLPGRWIRRTECGVGGALLLAASLANAAVNPGPWETANNSFAQGNYAAAARGYETIIAQQGYSAPVLFNLANAQQRDGQLGQAVLNYERAALLAPNDPDLAANLNSARQKAGLAPERPSPMRNIMRALTLNSWFGLATAALFLIAVAPLLKRLRPQLRRALNFGSVLATFTLLVAVSALGLRGTDLRRAVVTTPAVVAGVSPVTVAQPVFKLRAGEVVTLQKTHGDFALIRNPSGQEGWVKAGDVVRVMQ